MKSSSSSRPLGRAGRIAAVLAATTLALAACAGEDTDGTGVGGGPTGTPDVLAEPDLAPGAPADEAGGDGPRYPEYVALGDSFAAMGPTDAPTSGPDACYRSTRNYAALLDERPEVGWLVDVTCGGAVTADLTDPQIAETPPQLDALTSETSLVTLSIGGNDIGFGAIVDCVLRAERVDAGAPCRERLEQQVTGALGELGGTLDDVHAAIRDRAPDARVVVTGYLPLVPADGGCDFVSRMSPGDVTWVRHVSERINLVVRDAAERAGADYVLPEDAQENSACAAPAERYTDFLGVETASHPMHPTAEGHRAMADAVAAVL